MTEQQKIQVHNALFGMEFKPLTVHRRQWKLVDNEENTVYSVMLAAASWIVIPENENSEVIDGDYSEVGFSTLLKTIKELV